MPFPKISAIGEAMTAAERAAAEDLAKMTAQQGYKELPNLGNELVNEASQQGLVNQIKELPSGSPINPASESAKVLDQALPKPMKDASDSAEVFKDLDAKSSKSDIQEADDAIKNGMQNATAKDFEGNGLSKLQNDQPISAEEIANLKQKGWNGPFNENGPKPQLLEDLRPEPVSPGEKTKDIELPSSETLTPEQTTKVDQVDKVVSANNPELAETLSKMTPVDKFKKYKQLGLITGTLGLIAAPALMSSDKQESKLPPSNTPASPATPIETEITNKPATQTTSEQDPVEKAKSDYIKQINDTKTAQDARFKQMSDRLGNLTIEGKSIGSDAELRAAQEDRKRELAINNLGRGADFLTAAATHQAPNMEKYYSEQDKFTNLPVENLQERIKNQGNSPDSQVSGAARSIMEQITGKPLSPGVTADAIFKVLPAAKDLYIKMESMQNASDNLKIKASEAHLQKITDAQNKLDKQDDADLEKLNKGLNTGVVSARTVLGKEMNVVEGVGKLQHVMDSVGGDPNKLSPIQVKDMALAMANIMSNSNASNITLFKSLMPNTALDKVREIEDFLTSKQHATQLGDFVKNWMETLSGQKEYAENLVAQHLSKSVAGFQGLGKRQPAKVRNVLMMNGLDPDLMDKILSGNAASIKEASSVIEKHPKKQEVPNTPTFTPDQESIIKKYTDQGYKREDVINKLHLK